MYILWGVFEVFIVLFLVFAVYAMVQGKTQDIQEGVIFLDQSTTYIGGLPDIAGGSCFWYTKINADRPLKTQA